MKRCILFAREASTTGSRKSSRRFTRICLACLALFVAGRLDALSPTPSPDWGALAKGRIIVDQARNDRGTPGLRCYLLVAGNEDKLFDKLKSPDFFKASYSNIEQMRILRRYRNGAEVEFVINALVTKVHYVVSRRYDRKTYTVWWTKVSGDLKEIEGSWRLQPSPYAGKYLLVYESFVDPGMVPPGLYVSFAKLKAESNLKKLRALLEK